MHLPNGAIYKTDFIDAVEESALVDWLDRLVWDESLKRRVQHFSYRYDYKARTVLPEAYLGPLSRELSTIAQRLVDSGHFASLPDQVIANEYRPGHGISAHIDCVPCFDDTIVSVSLLSQCEMIFTENAGSSKSSIMLERRSAIILQNEARYGWTHAIPARKSDVINGKRVPRDRRISLTFRRVTKEL
ncbi:MAG: alpha-ketoglutarate-dependent dioxygenase AlkB [Pseudomonadota bacterium]